METKKHGTKQEVNKYQKLSFYGAVAVCFLTILAYNFLTPVLSDDMDYTIVVRQATGFADLIRQEYAQYMSWTGRSIGHFILRLFLSTENKALFNVWNSLMFTLLTLLMYWNVRGRKAYDAAVYVLITLLVWIFGVSFAETVLWETGACNYLLAVVVILLYLTLFRRMLRREAGGVRGQAGWTVPMLLLGVWAGWSSENTSGGCILLTVIWLWLERRDRHTDAVSVLLKRPPVLAGFLGSLLGFALLIRAPGNFARSAVKEELHSGLLGMAARLLKITISVKEQFLLLLLVFLFLAILLRLQGTAWRAMEDMLLYFFIFFATCYALCLVPYAQTRVYFGAGIFLTIACVQGFVLVREDEVLIRAGKRWIVAALALYMAFVYVEDGAHLARIYREETERYDYVRQAAARGEEDVTLPMLRPQFQTKYTIAYECDLEEDWEYWVNIAYAYYFGVTWVRGVPREEWTGY